MSSWEKYKKAVLKQPSTTINDDEEDERLKSFRESQQEQRIKEEKQKQQEEERTRYVEEQRRQQEESQKQLEEQRKQEIDKKAEELKSLPKATYDVPSLSEMQKNEEEKKKKQQEEINSMPLYSTEELEKKYGKLVEVRPAEIAAEIKARERAENVNAAMNNGNYGEALGFVLEGLPEGVKSGLAGIGEAGLDVLALALDYSAKHSHYDFEAEIFNNWRDTLLDSSQYLQDTTSYYQKALPQVDNGVVRTSGQVTNTVGEMVPSIASNFVAPGSGAIVSGVQVMGHSATENLNEDRDNLGKSVLTGLLKGTAAATVEKIIGGDFISEGTLDNWAVKKIAKVTDNKLARNILWKTYQVGGEVAEENLEDSIDDVIDAIVNEKDLPTLEEKLNQIGETSKVTGLSTIVLQALGLGGESFDTALNKAQISDLNKNISNETNQGINQEQENANKLPTANEENSYSSRLKQQATEEINNSDVPELDKKIMLDVLNKMENVTDGDMEAIRQTIDAYKPQENVELEDNKLETAGNYKNDQTRRQKYMQYKNDTGDYDSTVVNEVLDTIPENRNGRRTVKQWLQAAEEIGNRTANLSNEEIEKIAYKSWFELEPTKNITQYDNVAKKNVAFQKLTSDEWINTINNAVNEARANNQVQNQVANELPVANEEKAITNDIENSNKSSFSFDEINSKISNNSNKNKLSKDGITMTYVHMNNQNTQNYGTLYGQNIEPSGEYMNVDTMEGKYKVPGADYGTIHFDNPLILDHINTGETGWKKTLSEMFENKTGKELSSAIKDAGYDGIITIDEDGYYNEVVNLNGKKTNSQVQETLPVTNQENVEKNNKQKQLDIIKENNPMTDEYHTGIRNIEDIKTFEEAINDDESFVYGDFTKQDAEKALKEGKITVYSSNPIEQGSFVSTSQNMAKDYAGNGKVYSQEVDLKDVAWINGDEGQYAKTGNILENRVSGDELLNAQDLIEELKNVGAKVDNNGYVTVYHQTTEENANNIIKSGKMSAKEDGIFFSTSKDASQADGKGNTKLEFKIPAEKLVLDDIFDNNADVKIPLTNKNETVDISDYLVYNNNESESGINGQKENLGRYTSESNLLEERKQNEIKYKEWEKSIKSKQESEYTREEREVSNYLKDNFNKTVKYIKEDNNQGWNAGASLDNKDVIYINPEKSNEFGLKRTALHETMESNIRFSNENNKDIILSAINDIIESDDFKNQKQIFWRNQKGEMPSDTAIAKDIICDRFAEMNGEKLDYKILDSIKNRIDSSIEYFNIENSNESSFNLQENNLVENPYNSNDNSIKTATTENEQEEIAKILDEPIKQQKEKSRAWAIAKANLIDKGIVFEELSRKANNRELQGKWDYTLTAESRGQNAIGNTRYEMDSKTKTQKQISKSLEDIREEVGNNTSEFQNYMYHQLNIDRMTLQERMGIENKPVFGDNISSDYSERKVAEFEKNHPEFKEYAQDVYDFLNANKQELVDRGVISQELSDKLKEMYPHYVPIKRVDAKGLAIKVPLDTRRTGVNTPLQRATGGSSDIQPLFETIADRTLQTYKASARNSFGVELMNTLNSQIESEQTDIDTIIDQIGDENTELLKKGEKGQNPTFTVFDNGNKVTFEITENMYDALKPQSDIIKNFNNSLIAKAGRTISNIRRGVLTEYNPVFSLTNAIKDAQDVVANSQHAAKTYAKFPEAYAQILKQGYWYNEYVQNGGEQNSYFRDGEFTNNKKSRLKSAATIPFETISKVNNVVEMAPRLAEYIASREAGRSIETSMLDAARVTTNFKAGGDWTKTLNRNGATFLNASVQGFQQQIRNIQEANAKGLKGYAVLATKYAVLGLPAILLNGLIWKDDEDYQNLQDYAKDNYYIIGKYGDGRFIRIPKGRVAATIQKVIGNISEYITDDEKELNVDNFAKDFWEDIKFAQDNVAPNNPLSNNVLSPIIDVIKNEAWYGGDLVSKRLQDKPAAEQYDETTDSLSIWLGEKLNVSPYKINYLLDQYGGGVSDIVLPKLTKQAENNVLEDKFTTDSVMKNKYPGEFYNKLDELKVNSNSSKATDEDTLKYKYMSSISNEMSTLYQEKRDIQNSDMSDKQKKEKLKVVQEKINKLAQNSLQSAKNIDLSENTATIGDEQYYKKTSGDETTWNKLTDKEKEKNKNISLKTYSDYKNKIAEQTKDGGQLKTSDKINILLNSNYNKKEKAALYENYIDTDDSRYQLLKTTGIDIDKYLEYKNYTGTKKTEKFDYINNMSGLTYTQKVLLYGYGANYKLSDSQLKYVKNYINNLNISKAEKEEYFKHFK